MLSGGKKTVGEKARLVCEVGVASDQGIVQVGKGGVCRRALSDRRPVCVEEERGEHELFGLALEFGLIECCLRVVFARVGRYVAAHKGHALLARRILVVVVAEVGRLRQRAIQHALGEVVSDVEAPFC